MSSNVKGALLALVAVGLYSTHDVFIKILGATYSAMPLRARLSRCIPGGWLYAQ